MSHERPSSADVPVAIIDSSAEAVAEASVSVE
jgi:hypothetical protein